MKEKVPVRHSVVWAVFGGAVIGVLLRLIFAADPGERFSAMAWPFIYFVPIAVSAISLYLDRNASTPTWWRCFYIGALANGAFVLGTLIILIEGLICAIVIVPLFMIIGGVAGLTVGAVFRWTKWPKSSVNGLVVLPVLLALGGPETTRQPLIDSIHRTVVIEAPAQRIWTVLMDASDIKPSEMEHGWIYRIGVPMPLQGLTKQVGDELVREVKMGKSVYFDMRSTDWQANQHVKWNYRFYEDSIPPRALDDHVKIGGHYFDILETAYSMRSLSGHRTELDIKITYRVSTDFDWYANAVAQVLIGNFGTVALSFYRHRAEEF